MNTEIECRLLDCNVQDFVSTLQKHNAKFIGDWLQIRNCYDFNPVKENSWIRLRTNGTTTTLTIKEINSDKIDGTKESEIVVSDFNETDEILNKLGYYARSKQENRRIQYILDNVEIDIDFWPMLPPYVEFEAKKEEDIISLCKKIGIEYNNLVTLDVTSIYGHYGIPFDTVPSIITLEDDKKNMVVR